MFSAIALITPQVAFIPALNLNGSHTTQGFSVMPFYCLTFIGLLFSRAVSVNALIYAINLSAINALKYFSAINATLFTSGVR